MAIFRELSASERNRIISARELGIPTKEIAEIIGYLTSIIRYT